MLRSLSMGSSRDEVVLSDSPRAPTSKKKNDANPTRRGDMHRSLSNHMSRHGSLSGLVLQEAIRKEEELETISGLRRFLRRHLMFHPRSNIVSCWAITSIFLIIYITIVAPFLLCFSPTLSGSSANGFDVTIDIFFVLDIFVNFRTGFKPNASRPDVVIMDPQKVAKAYIFSWLPLDIVSGIPFAVISVAFPGSLPESSRDWLRALKLLRVAKFLKHTKFNNVADKLEDLNIAVMVYLRNFVHILRGLRLFLWAVVIVHYVACGWWACGKAMPQKSWWRKRGLQHVSPSAQYLYSVYWVVTTMTTVGYGDVTATNDLERAYSIFAMVLGGSFYGLVIAKISSIVAEAEAKKRHFNKRMDEIASYAHSKHLPLELQRSLLHYYRRFLFKASNSSDDSQILSELSPSLRNQVVRHLLATVVTNGPFFHLLGSSIVDLFSVLKMNCIDRGHYVTKAGKVSQEMVVILAGSACVMNVTKESILEGLGEPVDPLFSVLPGAVFGELNALDIDLRYHCTVRALTNIDAYRVSSDEVRKVLKPTVLRNMRLRIVRSRVVRIKLATYRLTAFPSEAARVAIKRVIKTLPRDPHGTNSPSHSRDHHKLTSIDATLDADSLNIPETAWRRSANHSFVASSPPSSFALKPLAEENTAEPFFALRGSGEALRSPTSVTVSDVGGGGGQSAHQVIAAHEGSSRGDVASEVAALRAELADERRDAAARYSSLLAVVQEQQRLLSALVAKQQSGT